MDLEKLLKSAIDTRYYNRMNTNDHKFLKLGGFTQHYDTIAERRAYVKTNKILYGPHMFDNHVHVAGKKFRHPFLSDNWREIKAFYNLSRKWFGYELGSSISSKTPVEIEIIDDNTEFTEDDITRIPEKELIIFNDGQSKFRSVVLPAIIIALQKESKADATKFYSVLKELYIDACKKENKQEFMSLVREKLTDVTRTYQRSDKDLLNAKFNVATEYLAFVMGMKAPEPKSTIQTRQNMYPSTNVSQFFSNSDSDSSDS